MLKTKYKIGLALLATAASALTACGKKKDGGSVIFWSSFGSSYTDALNAVVNQVAAENSIEIDHKPQGDYKGIYKNMLSAIADGKYPNLAIGYPDHFASYLGSGILKPLDEYFSKAELDDYYDYYLTENKFYDNGRSKAQERLYGIPFNKSTELLGYNGVFVDYCASVQDKPQYGYSGLENVPATWGEWEVKGAQYDKIYQDIMGKGVYGHQDVFGNASDFKVYDVDEKGVLPGTVNDDGDKVIDGRKLLLDLTSVTKANSILMGWDATDNAFITLLRQWGVEYTKVADEEKYEIAADRIGTAMFNKASYQPTVISMLKFFNKLHKAHIFGTPQTPLNADYCSDAYQNCKVMFMICSSGGLSHTTADWHLRFRSHPIPYKDAAHKSVISQGANICMTDRGSFENSVKAIKAFTTGKFQTDWCLATGYYPCSKSATNSEAYQKFIHEGQKKVGNEWVDMTAAEAEASGDFNKPIRVAYREGSRLNEEQYMDKTKGWDKFVDPGFSGSSDLRDAVATIFDSALSIKIEDIDNDALYKAKLDAIENMPAIKNCDTIAFAH